MIIPFAFSGAIRFELGVLLPTTRVVVLIEEVVFCEVGAFDVFVRHSAVLCVELL